MKGWMIVILGLLLASSLFAFPTQSEIKTAGAVVGALVKGDIDAAKAGRAKHTEVADKIYGLVADAESDGAKWLLLKHAFIQYAKGGDYDKAADMMEQILATFPDVPPAQALALISNNAARAKPDNAAKLLKFRDLLTMRQKCAAVLASPKATRQQKAEALCLSGNWKDGLAALAKLGGEVGAIAAKELAAEKPSIEAANFWWDYKSSLDTCGAFRAHAVELYEKGLADGSLTGLYRNLAEQRIEESKQGAAALAPPASSGRPQYMIIDLSSGCTSKRYPVTYCAEPPVQPWTDEYKTTKLVLKRIEAGKFMMGCKGEVTISKPFWMAIFELTQGQWESVMGTKPWMTSNQSKGGACPAVCISYTMMRGSGKGLHWPSSSDVDSDSFLGRLRACTRLLIDLPTEAQWEYACRAGTDSEHYYGANPDVNYTWCSANSSMRIREVGLKLPNSWGLFDLYGNVWDGCLNWYGEIEYGKDPKGPKPCSDFVVRGGSLGCPPSAATSFTRGPHGATDVSDWSLGFRLACPVSR